MNPSSTSSSQNLWFSVSLGLLGIIIGYTAANFNVTKSGTVAANPGPPPPPPAAAEPAPSGDIPAVDANADHILGKDDARISLVTYSDFDCPYSKRHHPTMAKIREAYGDDVNIVYRHFPLSFHQFAQQKAEASECVAELGGNEKFWAYADELYDPLNTTGVTLEDLAPLAAKIGIPEGPFKSCLESGKYTQKVKDQETGGVAGGVTGTPGNILIDNKTQSVQVLTGARPLESFTSAIDAILAQ